MNYLEYAGGAAFLIAGFWFSAATLRALANGIVRVDVDNQSVTLERASDGRRFRSAILFQLVTALVCLFVGGGILVLKLAGFD